ncbi:unnamed protein product [Cuscuta campestris]|uniref:Uncharacterized protein n=1 Tax=Cuscuta campestris TaxID=132261 RepID=A0A484KRR9_9ASTE|nr:unnamed protein product [Cuscuta campestris]
MCLEHPLSRYQEVLEAFKHTYKKISRRRFRYPCIVGSFLEDMKEAIKRKYYYFDNKPVLVQQWKPEKKINLEELINIPIWVLFPDLDVKYWSLSGLSKLGSLIRKRVKRDKATAKKTKFAYARIQIEVKRDVTTGNDEEEKEEIPKLDKQVDEQRVPNQGTPALHSWLKYDLASRSLAELKEKMWNGKNRKDKLWIASSIVACCYYVWKARNSKLHNKKDETSASVVENLKANLVMAVGHRGGLLQ